MEISTTNTRKRSSQTPIEELEAQHRISSPGKRQRISSDRHGGQNQGIYEQPSTQPSETIVARFKQPEDLLGPQICSLCERNITKSVKILCAECGLVAPATAIGQDGTMPANLAKSELVMCLECLRLGKTT